MTEYRVTERDMQLVLDVYKYRYLSGSQVQFLHFPSERTAYRRLQALTKLRYLAYFTVPNIPERVYHLDIKGAELVAGELQVEVKNLAWHKVFHSPKDYYFLRHFLKLNDFRLRLTSAVTGSQINLLGFIPDYVGEKIAGNIKKYIRDQVCDIANGSVEISHTPDAVFALEKEKRAALFFLEIDRGTESLTNPVKGFLKAMLFYLNYWVEGKYSRYQQDFNCPPFRAFRVLIVTSSEERVSNMREAVSNVAFPQQNIKRFFWAATDEKLNKETIFTPLWLSLDKTDDKLHQIG